MSRITKQDTNGVKPLLAIGELGYDNYPTGGDVGRVYVGTGTENIALAKKTEVIGVDGKADAHIARVDNPHNVTKAQVGLANVDNTSDAAKNVLSATKLTTARTINGVSFDGTANITVADSTKLPLAGGTMTGVIDTGSSLTTGFRFDGRSFSWNSSMQTPTANVPHIMQQSYSGWDPILGIKTTNGFWQFGAYSSDQLHLGYMAGGFGSHSANSFDKNITFNSDGSVTAVTFNGSLSGNAATATTLQTARTINGVSFNGSANITIPAGATGAGSDKIFFENGQTITTSYSITSGMNAMTAGPITINNDVTITIPDGSSWTIV